MNAEIENLLRQLTEFSDEKDKGLLSNILSEKYIPYDPSVALKYAEDALEIFQNIGEIHGIIESRLNIINWLYETSDYLTALKKCEEIEEEVYGTKMDSIINRFNRLQGLINYRLSNHDIALIHLYKCLEISEQSQNLAGISGACSNLGNVYMDLSEFDTSMSFHKRALEINEKQNNTYGTLLAKGNIANLYGKLENYTEAISEYKKILMMPETVEDPISHSRVLVNLGTLYLRIKNYAPAEDYCMAAQIIGKKRKNAWVQMVSLMNLGEISIERKEFNRAEELLNEAFEIIQKANAKSGVSNIHELFSRLYKETGDYKKALYHYQQYSRLKNEIFSQEKNQKITLLKMQAIAKEKEIERLKNVELKRAYNEIEEKNREITASINYAKRIQTANLPSSTTIKTTFPFGCIGLYQPKDILSGDMLWIHKYEKKSLIAAIDCTGHGIPGALLTIIANELLNTAVDNLGISNPGAMLNYLNKAIRKKFNEGWIEEGITINDGMDITFCSFDFENSILEYSGANRPLFLVRNGVLHETPPTKHSIGGHTASDQTFENHVIKLEKGDYVYLFSDGYADQFGMSQEDWKIEKETGVKKKRKKFMVKQLKQLLVEISGLNKKEKFMRIQESYLQWKGDEIQTDDVLLFGIEVG